MGGTKKVSDTIQENFYCFEKFLNYIFSDFCIFIYFFHKTKKWVGNLVEDLPKARVELPYNQPSTGNES